MPEKPLAAWLICRKYMIWKGAIVKNGEMVSNGHSSEIIKMQDNKKWVCVCQVPSSTRKCSPTRIRNHIIIKYMQNIFPTMELKEETLTKNVHNSASHIQDDKGAVNMCTTLKSTSVDISLWQNKRTSIGRDHLCYLRINRVEHDLPLTFIYWVFMLKFLVLLR